MMLRREYGEIQNKLISRRFLIEMKHSIVISRKMYFENIVSCLVSTTRMFKNLNKIFGVDENEIG